MIETLNWRLALVFIMAAGLAWGITYAVRQIARRHHLLTPPNERSSHVTPTPRLGGIGIVASFTLTVLAYAGWQPAWAAEHWTALSGLLLGGILMAAIGLLDDFYSLSPRLKFMGQVLVALVPVLFGLRLTGVVFPTVIGDIFGSNHISFGLLGVPLTILWIVSLVNLFNFMDGIDGLLAGVMVTATLFFVFLVEPLKSAWMAVLLVALGGACLGFLRYNASPASIFMGDSGSLFLGFMLAGISIVYAPGDLTTPTSLLAPVILLSALLFDGAYTLIRRILLEENIFKAHRSHLYQRLVILGYSHRRVSELYYILSLVAGGAALTYFYSTNKHGEWVAVIACLTVFSLSAWLVGRLEQKRGSVIIIRNRYYFILDLLLIPTIVAISFLIRLDTVKLARYLPQMRLFIMVSLIVKPLVFYVVGFYRRLWRYASIGEMALIVNGVALSAFISALAIIIMGNAFQVKAAQGFPRSVIAIDFMLAVITLGGVRFYTRLTTIRNQPWFIKPPPHPEVKQALIMGAGDEGVAIARELAQNPAQHLLPVGFVDDDTRKLGLRIYGIPVLGTRYDIPRLVGEEGIDEVIIAMPSAPGSTIRAITNLCESAGVSYRTMPGLYELFSGEISANRLREVRIEDLLRREPVQTDTVAVRDLIRGKRVLITGGGGSIGSEICRQVLQCEPAELVLVGHGENSVFEISNEIARMLRQRGGEAVPGTVSSSARIHATIADIRSRERMRSIFEEHRPHVVFHTAAHKHVPLMELNPIEAITNNVLGTRNLLDVALDVGVEYLVMISTDKAVRPTSIMGASKRIAELLVHQAARNSGRPYVTVRFGNVLGSRGSVVPLFKQQIAAGGPVTVTHPDMRRYFMTIPEAVQLVLQAAALGQGGEVFVLDMGEPVKIVDLARDMIELSGLEVGRDIDIAFTGIRPGEKLFEELFVPGESYCHTRHEKIFIAANASSFIPPRLDEAIAALENAAQCDDKAAILHIMQGLIPEFRADQANEKEEETGSQG